jgi:protein-tyrosine kinase
MTGDASSSAGALSAPAAPRIGETLVKRGFITKEQAGRAAQRSIEENIRFGEACVELGFISSSDLQDVLAGQLSAAFRVPCAGISREVSVFHEPDSAAAEDVRSLRNALTLRWFQHPSGGRALSVIGPQRGEGRSLVAANLAVAFAQVGVRTLLIDADMRYARQHRLFGLENGVGLTGYLSGQAQKSAQYYFEDLEELTVIPVGPLPPSPQELLLRPSFAELLDKASHNFEVILIDTPAASIGSDYQIIASASRGAMLVTHRRATRVRDAARVLSTCNEIGVTIVGGSMLSERG